MKLSLNVIIILSCGLVMAGCGGRSGTPAPERAVVTGVVKFNGNLVKTGQISFLPQKGPVAMGPISEGAYRIDAKGGVPVGSCKVEILGYEETGKEVIVGAGGKKDKETKQIIPTKYNTKSAVMVTIEADNENHHNFDLK